MSELADYYRERAQEYDAVYDKPALIQPDLVHPTAAGIDAIVRATADEVAEALPVGD